MSKVTLRRKPIDKGTQQSLFLDIYPPVPNPDTGKLQRKYYLLLYLFSKPRTTLERDQNNETLELARWIASKRQIDIQNMRYDFLSQRMMKGNFVEFFVEQLKGRHDSNLLNWKSAIEYFKSFAGEKILFPQINETFCEEYADYLLSSPAVGRAKKNIDINTAVSYYAKFKATLKEAFKKRYLPVDIGNIIDSITPKDTHREFLFQDEIQKLMDTPCTDPEVKRASLFSILTGLRYSDISTLDWTEIRGTSGNYSIHFSVDKTRSAEYLPISDQAYNLLGDVSSGVVFKNLRYYKIPGILRAWLKDAGIDKAITFHCFRHTFATLQLSLGTDIVTVSKMLGHKDIKTTMIYVKIVDSLKRDAAMRIKLNLDQDFVRSLLKMPA